MLWIAPLKNDTDTAALEKRLWDADLKYEARRMRDEVRSGLTSSFILQTSPRLPSEARFDYLLNRPEAENIGAKVNAAIDGRAQAHIEKHNPQLAGVLPKTYNLFTSTLLKELLKKVSEIPASLDYDAFGRIYEYFLGEFAMSEGQGGGEPSGASSTTGTVARRVSASDSANQFYTPSSIVRLLTEVIEPYHGRILDPACGSGGMFVSSARFVSENLAIAA